jgi:hypothetical protein
MIANRLSRDSRSQRFAALLIEGRGAALTPQMRSRSRGSRP